HVGVNSMDVEEVSEECLAGGEIEFANFVELGECCQKLTPAFDMLLLTGGRQSDDSQRGGFRLGHGRSSLLEGWVDEQAGDGGEGEEDEEEETDAKSRQCRPEEGPSGEGQSAAGLCIAARGRVLLVVIGRRGHGGASR